MAHKNSFEAHQTWSHSAPAAPRAPREAIDLAGVACLIVATQPRVDGPGFLGPFYEVPPGRVAGRREQR